MRFKTILRSALACLLSFGLFFAAPAQRTTRQEVLADLRKAGGVFRLYPEPGGKLTPPPEGYRPCYVSHYGRHGSRRLLTAAEYDSVAVVFARAARAGVLTPLGEEVRRRVDRICEDAAGRAGDLTLLGAEQHRGIAGRMVMNCPEVFRPGAHIECRSTVVVRCVLSMAAFTQRLAELNPQLKITCEASKRCTQYLNYTSPACRLFFDEPGWNDSLRLFRERHMQPARLMASLFGDADYVRRKVDARQLMEGLYLFASAVQGVGGESLYDLFEPEELYEVWQCLNYNYYVRRGASLLNRGMALRNAHSLLRNFLDEADAALRTGTPAASLRFGHDGNLMSLLALMRVEGCCAVETDPERFADAWCDFRVTPMAANLQLIFYRHPMWPREVLVKILHNECEVAIPVASDLAPYYRWADVKAFYEQILSQ